jgi:hypothetical protein
MGDPQERVLSAREAAGILYNTAEPSDEQVNKVRAKIARGHLRGSPRGHWTTTSGAVADYLAGQLAQRRGAAAPGAHNPALVRPTAQSGPRTLGGFYRQLLKDYLLALALRRSAPHRSARFRRAVLSGQVALLALAVLLALGGYRTAVSLAQPPERAAVERWLADNVGYVKVREWFEVEAGADETRVGVRYRYFVNRRPVDTQRVFVVQGNRVVRVEYGGE